LAKLSFTAVSVSVPAFAAASVGASLVPVTSIVSVADAVAPNESCIV